MEAAKTLRRPANWQDFESLCKKLWGEIWQCPEIQKNGRLGQEQSGVDVFGTPFNDSNSYYGIQCKGKNEYTHAQFTEEEINREIKNAEGFRPPLKKYYLATTASNDSKIQRFVREKNLEHKAKGLFEIHVFGWESIVDLIDENKQTHDWYLKNQNYKTNKSVSVTFQDGLTELIAKPRFKQAKIMHVLKDAPELDQLYAGSLSILTQKNNVIDNFIAVSARSETTVNLSFIFTEIHITNTGSDPIEEYKVFLEFEGDIQDLADTNEKEPYPMILGKYIPNTVLWPESKSGRIVPKSSILVGDDTLISEDIFIKPSPIKQDIAVKWKLISKDFKDEGQLVIKVDPSIDVKRKVAFVESQAHVRTEEGQIEDYTEFKKKQK